LVTLEIRKGDEMNEATISVGYGVRVVDGKLPRVWLEAG
jgi:hypothetical protein